MSYRQLLASKLPQRLIGASSNLVLNREIIGASQAADVLQICRRSSQDFDAINIVTALHCIAKRHMGRAAALGGKDSALVLSSLADAAIEHVVELQPRGLANTAWAMAVLRLCDAPYRISIAAQSLRNLRATHEKWRSQELANLAWAQSVLGITHKPLLESIASSAMHLQSSFRPQELANTAWAFAVIDLCHVPLMESIASSSLLPLNEFPPQELANLSWAFASCLFGHLPMLTAIASASRNRITQFVAQDLANTAWAFSVFLLQDMPLRHARSSAAIQTNAAHQGTLELAGLAWSCAVQVFIDAPLRSSISAASLSLMEVMRPQELSNTVWAVATLKLQDKPLLESIAAQAIRSINQFGPKEIEMLVWSLCELSLRHCARQLVSDRRGGPPSQGLACAGIGPMLADGEGACHIDDELSCLNRLCGAHPLSSLVPSIAAGARLAESGQAARALGILLGRSA